MPDSLYIRRLFMALFTAATLFIAACGQKGPLYLPPTCSPVRADGTVVQKLDEDGEVLPPCVVGEPDAEEAADPEADDNTTLPEDDTNLDFQAT